MYHHQIHIYMYMYIISSILVYIPLGRPGASWDLLRPLCPLLMPLARPRRCKTSIRRRRRFFHEKTTSAQNSAALDLLVNSGFLDTWFTGSPHLLQSPSSSSLRSHSPTHPFSFLAPSLLPLGGRRAPLTKNGPKTRPDASMTNANILKGQESAWRNMAQGNIPQGQERA